MKSYTQATLNGLCKFIHVFKHIICNNKKEKEVMNLKGSKVG